MNSIASGFEASEIALFIMASSRLGLPREGKQIEMNVFLIFQNPTL